MIKDTRPVTATIFLQTIFIIKLFQYTCVLPLTSRKKYQKWLKIVFTRAKLFDTQISFSQTISNFENKADEKFSRRQLI